MLWLFTFCCFVLNAATNWLKSTQKLTIIFHESLPAAPAPGKEEIYTCRFSFNPLKCARKSASPFVLKKVNVHQTARVVCTKFPMDASSVCLCRNAWKVYLCARYWRRMAQGSKHNTTGISSCRVVPLFGTYHWQSPANVLQTLRVRFKRSNLDWWINFSSILHSQHIYGVLWLLLLGIIGLAI